MGLAIHDAVALEDRRAADRLCEVTFAGAGRTEEEDVFTLCDKPDGRELVDQRAIHLLIEIKIKGVERAVGVAEACELVPAFEQTVLPPAEFVRDQCGHQVEGRHLLALRLSESGFQNGSHARESELAERSIEFDEIHGTSPVRSMRSR